MANGDSQHTSIRELRSDPHNRREHNPRNIGMLVDALHAVGAARSIVIDETDTVLAGNGVLEAAAEAGIERVKVVDVDGETIVAVRRTGLSEEQKRKLAIYDNRTSELATWNVEQLKLDAAEGLDLQPFFTEVEQAVMFGDGVKPHWTGMPEFDQEDARALRTIKIHFATQEDVDRFVALVSPHLVEQTITPKSKFIWFPKNDRHHVADVVYAGSEEER